MTWEQKRAISALIEIASDALTAAIAIAPDEPVEIAAMLKDQIHSSRSALVPARDLVERLP